VRLNYGTADLYILNVYRVYLYNVRVYLYNVRVYLQADVLLQRCITLNKFQEHVLKTRLTGARTYFVLLAVHIFTTDETSILHHANQLSSAFVLCHTIMVVCIKTD